MSAAEQQSYNPDPNLPGDPMPEWSLFTEKSGQNGVKVGFVDPDGRYFPFDDGESLAHIRGSSGGRDTYIMSPGGGQTRFEEWVPKLVADNVEVLSTSGEVGQRFVDVYKRAVELEPRLAQVVISPSGAVHNPILAKTGGYATHREKTTHGHYEITLNTEDGWSHYQELLQTRQTSTAMSARKLGIKPEQMDAPGPVYFST